MTPNLGPTPRPAWLLCSLLVLAACRPTPTPELPPATLPPTAPGGDATLPSASATTPAGDATAPAPTGGYIPLPPEACAILLEDAQTALGKTFTLQLEAPFLDPMTQEGGSGCALSAEGDGRDFASPEAVLLALKAAFIGWEENPDHRADGPTGAAIGLTRDAGLLLVTAEWEPSPDADCPPDQPISACPLEPEQQVYRIRVQGAMK